MLFTSKDIGVEIFYDLRESLFSSPDAGDLDAGIGGLCLLAQSSIPSDSVHCELFSPAVVFGEVT